MSRAGTAPSALVTGASSGIGEAVVRKLSAAGYRVTAVALAVTETTRVCELLSHVQPAACPRPPRAPSPRAAS